MSSSDSPIPELTVGNAFATTLKNLNLPKRELNQTACNSKSLIQWRGIS